MTKKLKEPIKQFEEENNIIQRDITHLNNKIDEAVMHIIIELLVMEENYDRKIKRTY